MTDLIERQAAIDAVDFGITCAFEINKDTGEMTELFSESNEQLRQAIGRIEQLPSAQPDNSKYEYHYDHTDCIWYRPEARNRCPSTCAQYRDGWNDAMNYIFRDGEGYRPYRRDKTYE